MAVSLGVSSTRRVWVNRSRLGPDRTPGEVGEDQGAHGPAQQAAASRRGPALALAFGSHAVLSLKSWNRDSSGGPESPRRSDVHPRAAGKNLAPMLAKGLGQAPGSRLRVL